MSEKTVNIFNIQAYDGKRLSQKSIPVITEMSVEIRLNNEKIVTSACMGDHLDELAVGFLRSEGIIASSKDIKDVIVHKKGTVVNVCTTEAMDFSVSAYSRKKTIASSGARIGSPDESVRAKAPLMNKGLHIPPAKALSLMDDMLASAVIHEETHGTHCSALATPDILMIYREDIGRHNTIDMLGGYALLSDIDLSDKILLTTGRISSEIVGKVWTMGISVIISHSAPTLKALQLCDSLGITLIGYVRHGRMNIYTHDERVNQ